MIGEDPSDPSQGWIKAILVCLLFWGAVALLIWGANNLP